jgi:hypothetical protein
MAWSCCFTVLLPLRAPALALDPSPRLSHPPLPAFKQPGPHIPLTLQRDDFLILRLILQVSGRGMRA